MFGWLSTRAVAANAAETLYGEIVSVARTPVFYSDWGVPDTVEGRFEMIALHLALVLDRLSREAEAGQALGRRLTEACIADLDDNMREIGIGDLAVPRKVKKAAAALYDRHGTILGALASQDTCAALEPVLRRDIGGLPGAGNFKTQALARYVSEQHGVLADVVGKQLLQGAVSFRPPAKS